MNIEMILQIYNDLFNFLIFVVIMWFFIIGMDSYMRMKANRDGTWYNFKEAVVKKLVEMFMVAIVVWCIITILDVTFSIDVLTLFNVERNGKLILGIWLVVNIVSGRRVYIKRRFSHELNEIMYGDYKEYAENVLLDEINRYSNLFMLQKEYLGILKNLTPVSLIPLVAGYIVEGKIPGIDWNWYTIVFVAALLIYIFALWKCYDNMKILKMREVEIQNRLRVVQSNSSAMKK